MTRVRTLVTMIIPAMLAGGVLFGSAFSRADAGRNDTLGDWPAASATASGVTLAQAEPRHHKRHTNADPWPASVPTPPTAPTPPTPPPLLGGHGHGLSVSVHDGEVQIDGLEDMVTTQLDALTAVVDNRPDLPKQTRDKIQRRVDKVRAIVKARLGAIKHGRLDKIGPEMERMGDEIEQAMEGLDEDLSQLGDKFGRDFAKRFGKDFAKNFKFRWKGHSDPSDDNDSDSDSDEDDTANVTQPTGPIDPYSTDDEDYGDAVAGIKSLALTKDQKAELAKTRVESEQKIAAAKQQLEEMSSHLHDALADNSASEADIEHQIDEISRKEATIRKARILAWVKVRKLLDPDQRKLVEGAAKKSHH